MESPVTYYYFNQNNEILATENRKEKTQPLILAQKIQDIFNRLVKNEEPPSPYCCKEIYMKKVISDLVKRYSDKKEAKRQEINKIKNVFYRIFNLIYYYPLLLSMDRQHRKLLACEQQIQRSFQQVMDSPPGPLLQAIVDKKEKEVISALIDAGAPITEQIFQEAAKGRSDVFVLVANKAQNEWVIKPDLLERTIMNSSLENSLNNIKLLVDK